jgi:hypothetical protein
LRIAICSNLNNKKGLQRDGELLCEFLQGLGHQTYGVQFDASLPGDAPKCELMISLETVARHLLPIAPIHWLFVNPEWFASDLIPIVDKHFAKILTKTCEAQRIFEPIFPGRVFYVGFLSVDKFDATVSRENKFLHVGGDGGHRNTQAVIDAWKWKKKGVGIAAELTVVSTALKDRTPVGGVTLLSRVSDEDLKDLQNSHRFHLCPSATEGWGHTIREAQSVNAALLTTDAPPMNEVNADYLVPSVGTSKFHMATTHEVSAIDIHAAAQDMLGCAPYSFQGPRDEFLKTNESFRESFEQHIQAVEPSKARPKWKRALDGTKSIAFLGNFKHSFSTESDLAWSFEYDGHEVIRLQENEIGVLDLNQAFSCDMFLWVRTPDWLKVSDEAMYKFLAKLRKFTIPSCSVHLDKFFGLPEREALIGRIPFWKTDWCFSADGGHPREFKRLGVNHVWMPPAVVLRGCYPGTPRANLRCDVGFVGSATGYHQEYPERELLVQFLEQAYGNSFRLFTGYREQELNDLYASISVCVGDSCFANQPGKAPKYFSDRIPETIGRGGVLVHPAVEGLEMPGLTTHRPGDFHDLQRQVDQLLRHPELRRSLRDIGMRHVRENCTYSHRAQRILKTVLP